VDVVINGVLELENGKPTGSLSGRALRKVPPAQTCP
jgi:N-acyl-D-amino-acid deacylase